MTEKTTRNKRFRRNKLMMTALVGAVMTAPYVADGLDVPNPFKPVEAHALSGSGTAEDPYIITNLNDFLNIKNNLTAHYKLGADIDLMNVPFTPFGEFKGSFDGNGYKIKNLNINVSQQYTGLFSKLTNATVKNLTIENATVYSTQGYTGVLSGHANGSTIENISVVGNVDVKGRQYTGGLIGYTNNTPMKNIFIGQGKVVDSSSTTGGLTSYVSGMKNAIENIHIEVDVFSEGGNTGGFVGQVTNSTGTFKNIVVKGNVTGKSSAVGGAVGNVNNIKVENIFVYGSVKGSTNVGGIIGSGTISSMKNAYAFNESIVGSLSASTGKVLGSVQNPGNLSNIYAWDSIKGKHHSKLLTKVVSAEEATEKNIYQLANLDFSIWKIDEGETTPYLTVNGYTSKTTLDKNAIPNFAGGSGTLSDPYLISTPEHLKNIDGNFDSHFKLINDIDLSNIQFVPLEEFSGTLDGNGYKIKNLNINSSQEYTGLFSKLTNATVKNLTFENTTVHSSKDYTGVLAGYSNNSTIENVAVVGLIDIVGNARTGALVGQIAKTHLNNIYIGKGSVKGTTIVGGVVGVSGYRMENIHVEVDVTAKADEYGYSYAGGVFGYHNPTEYIKNIVSKGDVTATGKYVGGIGNGPNSTDSIHAENVFAYGNVKGNSYVGGLFGKIRIGTWKNVYAFNESVFSNDSSTTGKILGYHYTNPAGQYVNLYSIEDLYIDGHDQYQTGVMTKQDALTRINYEFHGLDFEAFDMEDGVSTPYLIFAHGIHPQNKNPFEDHEPPRLAIITPSTMELTNQNIEVTIDFAGDAFVREYRIGETGSWISYTEPFVVTENTTVYARSVDESGNQSISSLEINNIDKVLPTLQLSLNTTSPAEEVMILVNANDNVGIAEMKYAKGSHSIEEFALGGVVLTESSFMVNENGVYTVYIKDQAGNEIVKSIEVTNIGIVEIPNKPVVTPSTTEPTNQNVTLTVDFHDAVYKEYRVNGGAWMTASDTITVTQNGTYEFRGGNKNREYSEITTFVVNNIDKVAPNSPIITSTHSHISIEYPVDAEIKEYRINSGEWQSYTGSFEIPEGEVVVVEARAIDKAGNVSPIAKYTIAKDTTPPELANIILSTTELTNGSVDVTIEYAHDAVTREYRIGETGEWKPYSSKIAITENTTIYARSVDEAGNESIASKKIDNIDKVAPTINLSLSTTESTDTVDILVSAHDNKELKVVKYAKGNHTVDYFVANGTTLSASKINVNENGFYTVYAEDKAGNKVVKSIEVTNIEEVTIPEKPVVTPSTTEPTNQNVTLTVDFHDAVYKEYRVNGGAWMTASDTITVTQNGTYEFRGGNKKKEYSEPTVYVVDNIDKIAPKAPTIDYNNAWTREAVSVSISAEEGTLQYRINNGAWQNYNGAFELNDNATVEARAIDKAGNISTITTAHVKNIDRTPPATPNIVATGNMVSVTNIKDTGSGVAEVLFAYALKEDATNPSAFDFKPYTSGVMLPDGEYVVKVKVIDKVGNETVAEKEVALYGQTAGLIGDLIKDYILNPDLDNLNIIKDLINTLPDDHPDKEKYEKWIEKLEKERQKQLENLQNQVERKVVLAEGFKREPYISNAIKAVNELPDDAPRKPEFIERLNAIGGSIQADNAKKAYQTAERQVSIYEKLPTKYRGEKALEAINKLPDGAEKDELMARYQAVLNSLK